MHCPWVRKTRAWGYEVIRGIDEDDPLRVIRAFRYPTGLVFVDLNAQVGKTCILHFVMLQKIQVEIDEESALLRGRLSYKCKYGCGEGALQVSGLNLGFG